MTTQYKPRTDPSVTSFVGRIGSEKSIRYSQGNGKASVLRFSVAVSEAVGKADNISEETTWLDCVVFGNQADNLHKLELPGTRVGIVGRLRQGRPQRVKVLESGAEFDLKQLEVIPLVRGGVSLLGRPSSNGSSAQAEAPAEESSTDEPPF